MRNDAKRISAYSLSYEELEESLVRMGREKWRAAQVWQWLYGGKADGWDDMANLPKDLRVDLADAMDALDGTARYVETAQEGGGTAKLLLQMHDGELVETVVIPSRARRTVCVSSQVGCAFGCAFCASGMGPNNIVFMGMGEPFANYDNALRAARIMNDNRGLGIGARRITFSTCGVVPGIKRLAGEGTQFELSVSLHAPSQELREKIMPVARRWGLDELMGACRAYTAETNRIITFEYTLIEGFNDGAEHARMLIGLLKGLKCRVNLIPLNPVEEFEGKAPAEAVCEEFLKTVERAGINATLRRSKGRGVDASCGQLRRRRITRQP